MPVQKQVVSDIDTTIRRTRPVESWEPNCTAFMRIIAVQVALKLTFSFVHGNAEV